MKTLRRFAKGNYDEQEQVFASTSSNRAKASAQSPPPWARTSVEHQTTEQGASNHQMMIKIILPQGLLE